MKWLYIYRDGKDQAISAKTRSWEKAEEKAGEIRDSFDPVKQLQRQLEAKINTGNGQVEIGFAIDQFHEEVARLNRGDETRKKYKQTFDRLLHWCAHQKPALLFLRELDVPTVRSWISSWKGAPTTRHNQHQRLRTFFRFCNDQGWIPDNPAKKIKNVAPDQEETLPFTREQYDALIEATYYFDGRSREPNGNTVNSKRARAYIQLLRWSGLRAADGACLAKANLRRDGSLVLRQSKVKGHSSAPVYVLLPPDVAQELREVPPSYSTRPDYFFWSGVGKRRAQTSKWQKVFATVVSRATALYPDLFLDPRGKPKPAHLHMLRDTFAVEYLLAGMALEEVSRLLGHASVLVTQRHYAPWVLERQKRLESSQRKAWAIMGIGTKKKTGRAKRLQLPQAKPAEPSSGMHYSENYQTQ
jgi:integrase